MTLQARLETLDEDLVRELAASRCPEADANRFRALEKQLAQLQRRLSSVSRDRRAGELKESMAAMRPGDVFTIGQRGSQKIYAVVRKQQGKKNSDGILVVDPTGRYRRLELENLKQAPHLIGSVDVSKITSPTKKVRMQVGVKMESLGKNADAAPEPARSAEEIEIADAVTKVTDELHNHICNECAHRGRCIEAARKVEKIRRQIDSASSERDSGYDVVSRRLVDVVDLLNAYGFMKGEALAQKGSVLRRVYN